MRRNKIGVLILVVLGIFALVFGYREYTRKNEPVKDLQPEFQVSASQMITEFEANDSLPAKKYIGKLISVEGVIKQIDKDNRGLSTVVLGDAVSMSSVRCSMDSSFANDFLTLQKNQTITIKGMFTGFQKDETGLLGSDVILNRCVVDHPKTKKQD